MLQTKRCISLLLVLCLLLSVVPITAHAVSDSGICGENLTWTLSDDGVLTISGTGPMENYTRHSDVPWNGYSSSITSLIIEDGVTTIGNRAFIWCESLSSVKIGNSVTTIGDYAFYDCSSLGSVEIPDSVSTINNHAFYGCSSLSSVVIGNSVTTISDYAFSNCSSLGSVEIPDSVTTICDTAFYDCSNLRSLVVGNGVTTIGDGAFSFCSSLSSVKIGNSVTTIGDEAFLCCESLSSVVLPDSVTIIGNEAFSVCVSLGRVVIGNSVTTIGDEAFSFCHELSSLEIPDSVTTIGDRVFEHCHSLSRVIFRGDAPTFVGDMAFCDNTFTAYYPFNTTTWTDDVMQDYGGDITWAPYNPNSPFYDVPVGAFYEAPVSWALENGITTGASATSFNPNGSCLRAQVVTFLHRAEGNPAPASTCNPFTDVKSSDFFYTPVLWAVEKGITNGTSATSFGAFDTCNRAAVVTFLWRAAGSPEPESINNPFVDVKSTDFFFKPVLWAVENGITTGVDATHFGPTSPCNRAQVVTFLYRAYN